MLNNKQSSNNNSNSWEADLTIINRMLVIIPVKLYLACLQISNRVSSNEFSIVTDIKEKDSSKILLSDTFYIPKQKVTPGSIDYLPDSYKHNVCIHRHPNGCNGFSPTDKEFINQNFELSLLYTKSEGFINGIYNLKTDDKTIVQLPVEILIDHDFEKIDISNISVEDDIFRKDEIQVSKRLTEPEPEEILEPATKEDVDLLEARMDMLEDAMVYSGERRFEYGNF
jgi:hypothetical protein